MESRACSRGPAWWGPFAAALALLVLVKVLAPTATGSAAPPGAWVRATPTPSPCYGLTYSVVCGSSVIASTTAGSAFFDTYACSPWYESGPEVFHTFTLPAGGFWQVSAAIHDITVDLDVFLLGPQGCSPGLDCVDYGDLGVAVGALPGGATYHVAVDGYNGAAGDYHLEIECLPEELLFGDGFEGGDLAAWSAALP